MIVYCKALADSGIDAKELARVEMDREPLEFQVKALTADKALLLAMNDNLQLVTDSLVTREAQSQGIYEKRYGAVLMALSGREFQDRLATEEQRCVAVTTEAFHANLEARKTANGRAQELFIALADHVAEVSGPLKLHSMVRRFCGPALSIGNRQVEVDDIEPAVQVSASQESVPRELVSTLIPSLKGSSFDFVIEDSDVSKRLASELQVPSLSSLDLDPKTETRTPRRCCPAADIDLLKSESAEHALAYQKLLATFEDYLSPTDFRGTQSEGTSVQLQRINLLIHHIETMQDCIISFFNSVSVHFPSLNLSADPGQYGLQTFIIIQSSMEEMAKEHRSMLKKFDELRKFGIDVASFSPEAQCSPTGDRWPRSSWFNGLIDGIKALVRNKDDLTREI